MQPHQVWPRDARAQHRPRVSTMVSRWLRGHSHSSDRLQPKPDTCVLPFRGLHFLLHSCLPFQKQLRRAGAFSWESHLSQTLPERELRFRGGGAHISRPPEVGLAPALRQDALPGRTDSPCGLCPMRWPVLLQKNVYGAPANHCFQPLLTLCPLCRRLIGFYGVPGLYASIVCQFVFRLL